MQSTSDFVLFIRNSEGRGTGNKKDATLYQSPTYFGTGKPVPEI
jgi:hypothetical protein